ncbi:MAG: hypothetical protein CME26_12305 [Gemmatimonadetes bacterium]|nr:hypothetical protein [Gemmatimonadota bacterium]
MSCNPSHTPSQNQTSVQAPANRLSDESSPYLRQHAHNPVDWYPWGAAALAVARDQNKPIFLPIGYSSCYWCHVMEREVFENPELAARFTESSGTGKSSASPSIRVTNDGSNQSFASAAISKLEAAFSSISGTLSMAITEPGRRVKHENSRASIPPPTPT